MTEPDARIAAQDDDGTAGSLQSVDVLLLIQAHRAAAQAAVATVLGARVLSLELLDGPPPVGVVRLGERDTDHAGSPDYSLVRLLAYTIAGPIAEQVVGVGGAPLQGEPAYHFTTSVLGQMREPDSIDDTTVHGQVARLLLDHFGARVDDAAEATEHLAMNVETWVSEHWGAIAVVAANLLRHRHLSGDGARQLMPPMQPGVLG